MLRSRVVGNRVSTSVEPRTWFAATGFGGGQQAHDGDGTLAGSCPANNQFLRPSAIGRIAFSTGLLSIGYVPSLA